MDDADIATDLIERQRTDALARHTRRHSRGPVAVPVKRCVGCGGAIPVARRRAHPGATRCAACQAAAEVHAARRQRTGG